VPTLDKVMELVHPDDRELIRKKMDAALYEVEPYDFEHRIVRADGEVRWIHRRDEVVREEGGEPLRMIGTVHDITEHKALEGRLEYQRTTTNLPIFRTVGCLWIASSRPSGAPGGAGEAARWRCCSWTWTTSRS
jgi:hypothetical protein